MANAFTKTNAWRFAGPNGKTLLRVQGTLVIDTTATGGAAAGDLPASMFGLREIVGIAGITADDNSKLFFGVPAYNKQSLMVGIGASNAPIDLPNDTYLLTIEGLSV